MRFLTISGPAVTASNLEVFTLAELHTYRGTTGKTADDTRLTQIKEGINQALYEHLRQRFIKATGTNWDLVMDGPAPGNPLYLPHTPVNGGALVSLERGYYGSGGWTTEYTFAASDYVLEPEVGRITAVGTQPFPSGQRRVRVVYPSGWDVADIPKDLKLAALQWASVEYKRASNQREDQLSEGFEGGATSWTLTTIPAEMRPIIERYMRKDKTAFG